MSVYIKEQKGKLKKIFLFDRKITFCEQIVNSKLRKFSTQN